MTHPHHSLVDAFFAGLRQGELPQALLAPDMTVWTTTGGMNSAVAYQHAIRALQSLFPQGLHYEVQAVTAEADRAIAEVHGEGTLSNGDHYANEYVFVFLVQDGRIAALREHANPDPIRASIMPLLTSAIARSEAC